MIFQTFKRTLVTLVVAQCIRSVHGKKECPKCLTSFGFDDGKEEFTTVHKRVCADVAKERKLLKKKLDQHENDKKHITDMFPLRTSHEQISRLEKVKNQIASDKKNTTKSIANILKAVGDKLKHKIFKKMSQVT